MTGVDYGRTMKVSRECSYMTVTSQFPGERTVPRVQLVTIIEVYGSG